MWFNVTPYEKCERVAPGRRSGGSVSKSRPFDTQGLRPAMDIERINQIGSLLADLTARTSALRGYL
jgi:hypothetical protein